MVQSGVKPHEPLRPALCHRVEKLFELYAGNLRPAGFEIYEIKRDSAEQSDRQEAFSICVAEVSFIAHNGGVAFVVKSGAIRIARDGITVRPRSENSLILKTYLASRAKERSKVVSEMVRAFMRKLSTFRNVQPIRPASELKVRMLANILVRGFFVDDPIAFLLLLYAEAESAKWQFQQEIVTLQDLNKAIS